MSITLFASGEAESALASATWALVIVTAIVAVSTTIQVMLDRQFRYVLVCVVNPHSELWQAVCQICLRFGLTIRRRLPHPFQWDTFQPWDRPFY